MKKTVFVCAAAISLFSLADRVGKEPEPDWDKVCFMITNRCIRARHQAVYRRTWRFAAGKNGLRADCPLHE